VTVSTAEYLDSQDTLKDWFEDCVTVDPTGEKAGFRTTLYASDKSWMEKSGDTPLRLKSFADELKNRA
jgi:phage/plasmid-associated DNA primase